MHEKTKAHRSKRSKYGRIQSEQRRQLLCLVENDRMSIKEAAEVLGINYSTSKTILQLHRKTGRIDRIEKK